MMDVMQRATNFLDPQLPFGVEAEDLGPCDPQLPHKDQMILRMMVRSPESEGFQIPDCLSWLKSTILSCDQIQQMYGIDHPYVYVTVRHGPVTTQTDDLWHVDGFSMRIPHPPEQNYIWSSCVGTEVLNQRFVLPDDFDPQKHNLHHYFQDRADDSVSPLMSRRLYLIDPYVIHRRPRLSASMRRTFFRISFVPIEIEDDTCMINPLIPREQPYDRKDIREQLVRYEES